MYGYLSGTSMASPQVAGAAALLAGLEPGRHGGRPSRPAALVRGPHRVAPGQGPERAAEPRGGAARRGHGAARERAAGRGQEARDHRRRGRGTSRSSRSARRTSRSGLRCRAAPPTRPCTAASSSCAIPRAARPCGCALEASGWRFAKKAYLYKGTTGCQVVLKAGALSAKCAGPALALPARGPRPGRARGRTWCWARPASARTSAGRSPRTSGSDSAPSPPRASIRPPRPRRRRSAPPTRRPQVSGLRAAILPQCNNRLRAAHRQAAGSSILCFTYSRGGAFTLSAYRRASPGSRGL